MNLYNELLNIYTSSITNLFTISGNMNDINVYDNEIKILSNKLLDDLSNKNHVMVYSPGNGLNYYKKEHKEELYFLDKNLEKTHELVFKSDYANSQYNIVSGLHIIKTMLNTYQALREQYGSSKVKNLIVYLDNADIIFPTKPIEQMGVDEKMAISLIRELTNNTKFMNGKDVIILATESFYSINEEVRELPMNYNINVELPNYEKRLSFINYVKMNEDNFSIKIKENIALKTAGLNLITISTILKKGLEYIGLNLNKDVSHILANKLGQHVELFYPRYGFDKIIGYENVKKKTLSLIKRMNSKNCWKALCYVGPTGSGKDFHSEAFLFEANLPVLKLKTIKSKWYGETSIILENIKQVARSFDKVVIFKPEADKLFPDPEDKSGHQTDQEVAGLFLDWMADSRDQGKIFWLFNTSRPQMFPVDFQRRIEIKIPILDLNNDDKYEFIKLMFKSKDIDIEKIKLSKEIVNKFRTFSEKNKHKILFLGLTENYSSDNIRFIVNEVSAELEVDEDANIIEIIEDLNISVVTTERLKQTNSAKEFSTYKSLI